MYPTHNMSRGRTSHPARGLRPGIHAPFPPDILFLVPLLRRRFQWCQGQKGSTAMIAAYLHDSRALVLQLVLLMPVAGWTAVDRESFGCHLGEEEQDGEAVACRQRARSC